MKLSEGTPEARGPIADFLHDEMKLRELSQMIGHKDTDSSEVERANRKTTTRHRTLSK